MNIDEQYPIVSEEEAIRTKDWAAGGCKHVDLEELIMSPTKRAAVQTVKYPPALLKIFDEILVNALDQMIRTEGEKGQARTTRIDVTVSSAGEITIRNNGRGIPIEIHRAMSAREKRDVYLPTFLFNYTHQSSNHKKSADNIIGGTNGLGAKIVLCMSSRARLVTVDKKQKFTQVWTDGKEKMTAPIIEPYTGAPYTEVTFLPLYCDLFGYPDNKAPELIHDLFYTRVVFASLYKNLIAPQCSIIYNGVAIGTTPDMVLMELYPECKVHKITITPADATKPHMYRKWEIYAVGTDKKPYMTSTVNGIVVPKGTHIKHIKTSIVNILRDSVRGKLKDKSTKLSAEMLGKVAFIAIAPIPNPRWTGQRKEELAYDAADFAPYALTAAHLRGLSEDVADKILEAILSRKTKRSKIEPSKYKSAAFAGTANARNTILFCVEGDSAFAQAEMGISKTSDLTFERCGLYSLGGVIVNARKEIIIHDRAKRIFNKSEKWRSNARINGLIDVLGLNFEFKYEPGTPTYEREMKTLRYGCVIAAVDQDHDGKGNILPLLMSMFAYVWPGLIASGYIGWLMSPICQVYPAAGGKIISFYHLNKFDQWAASSTFKYDVKYCKGLAGNDDEEGVQIFKRYRENMFLFTLDPKAEITYDIYFGEDPNKRKDQLAKIGLEPTPEMLLQRDNTKTIPSTEHLLLEADAYQKDNLLRKLDNYIDGMTKSRRKVLDGCIERFRSKGGKRVKVADLAASVVKSKQYEHGEASLEKTIKLMAATYIGGRQLPYLVPVSMFGTRTGGPKTAGASRYIYAVFNGRLVNAIFPPEDYSLLKFTRNEGKRGEPEYFVPIIPTSVLESIELPAHGWKLKKWARDVLSIIDYVKLYIINKPALMRAEIAPFTYKWNGIFKRDSGKLFAVGKYHTEGDTVIVTELPMTVWTNDWVASIRAKIEEEVKTPSGGISRCEREDPYIDSIDDRGNNGDTIYTRVMMKPGAIAALLEESGSIDGIEKYLNLRKSQKHNLNLMTEYNTVREFQSYEAIIADWFPHRRTLYEHRLRRRRQLLRLRLELQTETLRYIEESKNLARESVAAMTEYVTAAKYPRLAPGLLSGFQIMSDEELEREFHNGDFNYLFKLSDLKKSAEAITKLRADIEAIRAEIARKTDEIFPGATEWLTELETLRAIIIEGRATAWKYGDAKKYTFE